VLSKDQFLAFAKKVVPFLHITTKIKGRKDDDLFNRKIRFGGYPTLVLMDPEGEILLTLHPSQRSLQGFEEAFAQASRYYHLREASKKDPGAAKAFLLLRMEMKKLPFEKALSLSKDMEFSPKERLRFEKALVETLLRLGLPEAKKAFSSLPWDPSIAARGRQILQDLEIRETLKPLRRVRAGSKKKRPYHLAYGLFKKGKIPSGKPHFDSLYWTSVSQAAFQKKDVAAFEAALKQLRKAFGKTNKRWLKGFEDRLQQLKKELGERPMNEHQKSSKNR